MQNNQSTTGQNKARPELSQDAYAPGRGTYLSISFENGCDSGQQEAPSHTLTQSADPEHLLLQSPSMEGILFAFQIRRHSSSPRTVGQDLPVVPLPPDFPYLSYGCHRGSQWPEGTETDSKECWETLCLLYRTSVPFPLWPVLPMTMG